MSLFYPQDRVPGVDPGPYHMGWKGWGDSVEVWLDGQPFGRLQGHGKSKTRIEYGFIAPVGNALALKIAERWPRLILPVGRRAAKAKLAELVEKEVLG